MDPETVYTENFFLSAGEANAEKEMSLPLLVSKLIDIATAHANSLGIGNPAMSQLHAGWVLSRLTVEMIRNPKVDEMYSISTWIEEFNRHFSKRCFSIKDSEGNICGYSRTIWMVMDTINHTNVGLSHFSIAEHLISGEAVPIRQQGKHLNVICRDLKEGESKNCLKATHEPVDYRFKYCDLDAYRHVNTVRYVALLLNQFTLEEYDKYRVKRLELSFMHEAKYDMLTSLYRSDNHEELISSFSLIEKDSEKPLMFAKIFRETRNQ